MTAAPNDDLSFSFSGLRRRAVSSSRDVLQQDRCPKHRDRTQCLLLFKPPGFLLPLGRGLALGLALLPTGACLCQCPDLLVSAAWHNASALGCIQPFPPGWKPSGSPAHPCTGCSCPRLSSSWSLRSPKRALIISPNNCVITSTEVFQMPELILLFMPSFVSNGILITSRVQKYWVNSA